MNISLVITTINKVSKNIKNFSNKCKSKKWNLFIIGDKKTPKNFKINYGNYLSIKKQIKTNFIFSKICPKNNYGRKNIGYLLSIKNKAEFIVETDDDNIPKKNFFNNISLEHKVSKIKNNSWINIYDLFIKKKTNLIWPRGLPLDELNKNKIKITKKKYSKKFFLQQGVAEKNPDVDAIFRLMNSNINVKFKNYKVDLGKSISTFNSQNTIWHKSLFELMYLPMTCTMRCTDIWRSLIALKILRLNKMNILFFGTTMYQERNYHDLMLDFKQELPMYENNKFIFNTLEKINLKKGKQYFSYNIKKCYLELIKKKIFDPKELKYLNAWIADCKKLQIFVN